MCIRDRGKVERPIGYVRQGFFYGRTFLNDADLNAQALSWLCLLYTSDAADERSSVDLGGRRIIKKKSKPDHLTPRYMYDKTSKLQRPSLSTHNNVTLKSCSR